MAGFSRNGWQFSPGIHTKDTSQLRLDEEMRGIDQVLRQSEFRDKFDIKQHWAVRVVDLQGYLLRHKPDILHFSGHGSESSEIILEDIDGSSRTVSTHALSQLFSVLKDNIRCVILNACYSEQQAKAIAEHIDCVVGMSKAIGDKAAISFATAFYQALGFGKDIKAAFDLGCLQIDLENLDEQNTPQLLAINSNPKEIVFAKDLLGQNTDPNTIADETTKNQHLPQPLSPWAYMGISAVGFVLAVGLLLLFIYKAPELIRNGISQRIFYFLLIPLGLATAAFVFGGMRTYARFTGQILSGTLDLGGPVVVAALVVIGGFKLVPPDTGTFSITVRVHDLNGQPLTKGKITLFLGQNTPEEPINLKGEANFKEIAMQFRNQHSKILANVDGYELAKLDSNYSLSEQVIWVKMRKLPEPPPVPTTFRIKGITDSGLIDAIKKETGIGYTSSYSATYAIQFTYTENFVQVGDNKQKYLYNGGVVVVRINDSNECEINEIKLKSWPNPPGNPIDVLKSSILADLTRKLIQNRSLVAKKIKECLNI